MPNTPKLGTPQFTGRPWSVDLTGSFLLGGDYVEVQALSPDGKQVLRGITDMPLDTDAHPNGAEWLEDAANARLVAYAPDLYHALRALVTNACVWGSGAGIRDRARADNGLPMEPSPSAQRAGAKDVPLSEMSDPVEYAIHLLRLIDTPVASDVVAERDPADLDPSDDDEDLDDDLPSEDDPFGKEKTARRERDTITGDLFAGSGECACRGLAENCSFCGGFGHA